MKSAIEKLFNGDINSDNIGITKEWERLSNKSLKIYEEFYNSLTEKQKQQFNELSDCSGGQEAEVALQYYKEGFKLGLTLAVESILA